MSISLTRLYWLACVLKYIMFYLHVLRIRANRACDKVGVLRVFSLPRGERNGM